MTGLGSRALAGGPRSGMLSTALAGARSFLLDPVEPAGERAAAGPERRPVIAVFGLARGCGSTVVARALAVELAARDTVGASAVACETKAVGIPLATQAAARLARALADVPGHARPVGRLCLMGGFDPPRLAEAVRGVAPVVIDVGSSLLGGVPASVADRTVIVTSPAVEPALARVASECVGRVGREPILVLNRARRDGEPGPEGRGETAVRLPESRMGAQLALGGREARGDLGRAIAELADRCEDDT